MNEMTKTASLLPRRRPWTWLLAMVLASGPFVPSFHAAEAPAPAAPDAPADRELKLLVVVVVDQLRGDVITRLGPSLGKDGVLRLAREGVWYRNAYYSHAHTVTGPGHATIGTGAWPCHHGIVGNDWFDRKTGTRV